MLADLSLQRACRPISCAYMRMQVNVKVMSEFSAITVTIPCLKSPTFQQICRSALILRAPGSFNIIATVCYDCVTVQMNRCTDSPGIHAAVCVMCESSQVSVVNLHRIRPRLCKATPGHGKLCLGPGEWVLSLTARGELEC